jgi:hypothetical protein
MIVAVGTSALREGLLGAPIMQAQFRERFGPAATFSNLSTFDQTFTESLMILSSLPIGSDTVVVLEMKPRRFAHSADQLRSTYTTPRLPGISDEAVRGFLEDQAAVPRTWRYRLAFRNYIEGRVAPELRENLAKAGALACGFECLSRLFTGPWLRSPRRYLAFAYPDITLPETRLLELEQQVASQRVAEFTKNEALNLDAAAAIVDYAVRRGARVLMIELPRHSRSRAAYAPIDQVYREAAHNLIRRGAEYVDFSSGTGVVDSDFYDLDHLRPSGREKVSTIFLRKLEVHLGQPQKRTTESGTNDTRG